MEGELMKWTRITLLCLFFLLASGPRGSAQQTGTAFRFRTGSNLPLTCRTGDVFYLSTGPAQYNCSATDTWTVVGGGGGGSPGGANTQVQFNDSGSFGGDAGLVYNKTTNFLTVTAGGVTLTSSTINGLTLTASTGTLTITNAKTFAVTNTLTLAGTDGSTLNVGAGGTLGSNAFTSTAYVPTSRAVNTTSPITGGGDLSADRTIACATCGVTGTGLNQFASTTSAQLAGVISNETGSGSLVFGTSPRITTSILDANGNQIVGLTPASSAINSVTVGNGASGDNPFLQSTTNVIDQRDGSTNQRFNVTGRYTDASNYNRIELFSSGTDNWLVGRSAGIFSGTNILYVANINNAPIQFQTSGANRWQFDTNGNFIANGSDNALDLGASGATRPRTGYFGTSIISPLVNATTGFQVNGAATSRKVLVGNGTNFVASTETYAVPGTNGNVMTSDGTNWTSAAPSGGGANTALSNLASVAINAALATGAGTTFAASSTAPAATTGASQAGIPLTLLASNAVASTDTNGAAAGGSVTITGGDAARRSSGNANGGNIVLAPGALIGSGVDGQVRLGTGAILGTAASPLLVFAAATTRGMYAANGGIFWAISGVAKWGIDSTGSSNLAATAVYGIASGAPDSGSPSVAWNRVADKVAAWGSAAGTADHWFQWAGEAYLATDQTNATATLASTTLSVTLQASRKYAFKAILYVSDDTAAEGVKADFGGGTATATNFRTHCTGFDTALGISTQVTSLTGTVSAGTFTGSGMIECHGSFEVNAGGTFIPRFAQNSHVIGTLTLFRGSHVQVFDTP
jgi:hypothetical protein